MGINIVELEDVKSDKKAIVVRHNVLIESKHSLTLTERRFMLWIVSQISKNDNDLKGYRINISDWVKFCGLKKTDNPYKEAFKLVDGLTEKSTKIKDAKTKRYIGIPWFSYIEYGYGEGYIKASINSKLKPYLLDLKEQYTKITIEYALLLNSVYAGRIYDLLKQYEKIGTRKIDICFLREMLKLDNKYINFKDFRRRVLEISQREINNKTDIAFDWQPIKTGRKVTAIRFTIRKNTPPVTLDSPEYKDPKAARLLGRLHKTHGVAEAAARDLVNDYDCERIDWHIKEYESQLKAGKDLKTGWLIKAIKTDHRPQQGLFSEQEKTRQKAQAQAYRAQQAAADKLEKLKDLKITIENNHNSAAHKIAVDIAQQASPKRQEIYQREFLQQLQNKDSFTIGEFEKKGWKSHLNRVMIIKFIKELYPDNFPPLSDLTKPHGFKDLPTLQVEISKLEKAAKRQ